MYRLRNKQTFTDAGAEISSPYGSSAPADLRFRHRPGSPFDPCGNWEYFLYKVLIAWGEDIVIAQKFGETPSLGNPPSFDSFNKFKLTFTYRHYTLLINHHMASLPPEATQELTPDQITSLYPPGLKLQYVQIFFRHGTPQHRVLGVDLVLGERTPVHQRLAEAGIPPFWNVCKSADEFREAALLPAGDFHSLHYRRKVEHPETTGRLKNISRTGERYW